MFTYQKKTSTESKNSLIAHLIGLTLSCYTNFVHMFLISMNNTGRETLFVQEGYFPANHLSQVFGYLTCCKGHSPTVALVFTIGLPSTS